MDVWIWFHLDREGEPRPYRDVRVTRVGREFEMGRFALQRGDGREPRAKLQHDVRRRVALPVEFFEEAGRDPAFGVKHEGPGVWCPDDVRTRAEDRDVLSDVGNDIGVVGVRALRFLCHRVEDPEVGDHGRVVVCEEREGDTPALGKICQDGF